MALVMKRLSLLLLLAVLTFASHAQVTAYYPNGKPVTLKYRTIRQLMDTLGLDESSTYLHPLGEVYFKRLTKDPVFVLFMDKPHPASIPAIIASYDYNKYINSYDYYFDLNDMIKDGTLTKAYVHDVFDEPDGKSAQADGTEYWVYRNYNAGIIFRDSTAISANVVNFKAMSRNKLSIAKFSVTGSEYSIGFDIEMSNYSHTTIKYAFITVTARNPVDDLVETKTVKAVGPIAAYATGSYEFADIIISRVAETLSIDRIKLQYMDGTERTIPKAEVKKIIRTDWEAVGQRTIND